MAKKSFPVSNALHVPGVLLALSHNVRRQRKFLQDELGIYLNEALNNNDGSLDKEDIKKITNYYGLAVPCILGEALCILRGQKMSLQERTALTYQGAMTGLFDDFFDKEKMSDDRVKEFMEKPANLVGQSTRQKLFLQFYNRALRSAPDAKLTLHYLRKVYDAQIESKKQATPGALSQGELKRITIDKGGMSVLFYRSVLSNKLTPAEEDSLYQMGGLMQFGNDIYDIYKDCLHHIDTLITTAGNVDDVRQRFRKMMDISYASVYKTKYKPHNIRRFHRYFSMCLCARCFVFFDQLEAKQMETGNIFTPYQYNRQELVCDMDKGSNKWRTVRYFIRTRI